MKELTFKTSSADETIELGRRIGSMLKKGDIIAMQGTLAAGKTTITKGIAESLADLGAYQNRFEMAADGVNVAAENLQAAESLIRDTGLNLEL